MFSEYRFFIDLTRGYDFEMAAVEDERMLGGWKQTDWLIIKSKVILYQQNNPIPYGNNDANTDCANMIGQ